MSSSFTRGEQVKQKLLRSIRQGAYGTEGQLPSIRRLSSILGVSVPTILKATKSLEGEGVIEARPGKGLFLKAGEKVSTKSLRIGLITPKGLGYLKGEPWPGELIRSIYDELEGQSHTVVPCSLLRMENLKIIDHIKSMPFDGMLAFEIDSDPLLLDLRDLNVALVSVDYDAYHLGISSVTFDNALGCFQTTKLLIDQGHRHIIFFRPWNTIQIGNSPFLEAVEDDRITGYRLAMRDAGLSPRIVEYDSSKNNWRATLLELYARRPAPTALVCVHDHTAGGAAETLMELGYRIPEDVSITGFGDLDYEYAPGKKFTTCWVDNVGVGKRAAQFVVDAIRSGGQKMQRDSLATKLIKHHSVAPPPSGAKST